MILKNCRLIPELCEGFQEEGADIRIEGNTIAEILPADGSYTGEEVIDCTGKTVLPGLFNVHVHLFFDSMPGKDHSEYAHLSNSIRYMNELLAYGYTSIRDLAGPYYLAIKLRNAINAGAMVGPDIKACGYALTPTCITAPIDAYSNQFGLAVNNPDDARRIIREQMVEGADYIKIIGSRFVGIVKDGLGSLFYPDELEEIKNAVKYENTYLAVHALDGVANELALEMDARTIEHACQWKQEYTDKVLSKSQETWIVPTLSVSMAATGSLDTVKGLRSAVEAGLPLGWGTDMWEQVFLKKPQEEFVLRSELFGLSSTELLKQATINSAKVNQTDDIRGSIKVGKRADFAIFHGKPDEDLNLFGTPCAYVLKDGVVVARDGFVKSV